MRKLLLASITIIVFTLICLACSPSIKNFEYSSGFYRIQLSDSMPFIRYFSVDALGNSELGNNTIQWKNASVTHKFRLHKVSETEVEIKGKSGKPIWTLNFEEKSFSINSNFDKDDDSGFEFRFDKSKNNTTLLGIMSGTEKTKLPALLHLPDMGSFILSSDKPDLIVNYDASRREGENYISIGLPGATAAQNQVRYLFKAGSVYPSFPGVEQDKYAGFRRNYLNLFQINPRLQVLANNSCSDPCAFTLFLSSMLALKTPPLTDSLTALDLLRIGLDAQYRIISDGILEGITKGNFQGACTNGGMTKDWKTWNGECWGYEGFLCDGYLALLAFNPEDN